MSKIPFPVTVFPQLQALCTKARGAIGETLAYIDTQLPFQYVLFLAGVVHIDNFFQATLSGISIAEKWSQGLYTELLLEMLFMLAYPTVYLSLMHVCDQVVNPLRAIKTEDFPVGAFSSYMLQENKAFFTAGSNPPFLPVGATPRTWSTSAIKQAGPAGPGPTARAMAGQLDIV